MVDNWDEKLSVGEPMIDEQHQHLAGKIKELSQAVEAGEVGTKLTELMEAMEQIAHGHFSYEERYLADHQYPQTEAHAAIHREFMESVAEMRDRFTNEGSNPGFAMEVAMFAHKWLVDHVTGADGRYCQHILGDRCPIKPTDKIDS